MSIKSELQTLQQKFGELLRVEDAVDWARRHPSSALHSALEWDNEKAGEEYRCWQMRQLIRVNIINEVGKRQTVSLTIDRVSGGGYRDIIEVMQTPHLRDIMLADALNELTRIQKKYAEIKELARVWQEVDNVVRKQSRRKPPQKQTSKSLSL